MVEPVVDSIRNSPVSEDGGEAAPAGFEQIASTVDVQEAFVLACKARGGEILGRGRAAHGNRNVGPIFAFELSIGLGDVLSKTIGTGGIEDDRACLGSTLGKHIYRVLSTASRS